MPRFNELFFQTAGAVWRNRWLRVFFIIFLVFEIYNTAILPAWRGTYDAMRARADVTSADVDAQAKTINGLSFVPDSKVCRRQDSLAKGGTGYPNGIVPKSTVAKATAPCP